MNTRRITVTDRIRLSVTNARSVAIECLVSGIEAAHPQHVVSSAVSVRGDQKNDLLIRSIDETSRTYDLETYDRVIVLGGGNAAGHVAAALEDALGDRLDGGIVVTDDPAKTERIEVARGDHPIPSKRGREGAETVLERADEAGPNDLVIGCVTGGASALLPAPAEGLSLEEVQQTTDSLLSSGAPITDINTVRKHLSRLKGGRLAQIATPATVVGLIISDVTGDEPSIIASGPLSPDPTTFSDAINVLDRYRIDAPDPVHRHLQEGIGSVITETPTGDSSAFESVDCHVIASATTALKTARSVAVEAGYTPLILSSSIRGEASEVAKTHVAVAEEIARTGTPIEPPAVVLSGGETTVTLEAEHGHGGPNQEFVLSGALELGVPATIASVDTDGIDGDTDAAGAITDETLGLQESELDRSAVRDALDYHDAYTVFEANESLIKTGPTGTNVNDLRAIVIPE